MKRIGIISDTHSYWDDKYAHYFKDCDEIWHAGDIGSMEIADNIVYLLPLSKVVSSLGRIKKIFEFGGVPYIYIIGASRCGFPFGFPACAIHIQKGYNGETKIEMFQ